MNNFPVLFLMNVESEIPISVQGIYVSDADIEYCSKYKNEQRQTQSILVRKLVREGLFQATGLGHDCWEIKIGDNGGRYAQSSDGKILQLSFSHSSAHYAVAIHSDAVGVDVEEIKIGRPWEKMQTYFERPAGLPPYKTQLEFLKGWTAYEAGLKYRSASNDPVLFHHVYPSDTAVVCLAVRERTKNVPATIVIVK
ncbi:hypothetical protein GUA87_06685 [Sneathiella sp. P13V-1]|uniref:4'-phosphopantetheinyl transferase family protein n=1 Tax=Sneathiella sp. P13V-1 TaxID=2697366 RepID=UPI00187B8AD3|nr:hypothetical protein [Sneathiella sp. P13V-1]MBE7636526.1 hypothetical protein [Sneathiella sp. P13V-1]